MEKYFRLPIKNVKSLKVSANDWLIKDVENKMVIYCFATTEQGHSVTIEINNVNAFFYIKAEHVSEVALKQKFKEYILQIETVEKMNFFGYNQQKLEKFYKIYCKNLTSFNSLRYKLNKPVLLNSKKISIQLFESNLDPLLRFFHTYNIQPCGYFNIVSFQQKISEGTQIRIVCNPSCIQPTDAWERKVLQASYDIECYSHDNSFPKPEIKENTITHISTTFKLIDNTYVNYIVSLNSNPIDSKLYDYPVHHYIFDSEKDLLRHWVKTIQKMDPDILYQYNGDQFDGYYIYTRCKLHGIPIKLSKIINENCAIKNTSFSSSAYGTTYYRRLLIPGRIHFDVMVYINRNFKEDSYSLEYISQKYLKTGKNEMTVQMMFDSYRNKDFELSKKVAEYCIKDTILPQQLIDHFNILQAQVSMANVCFVPFNYLIYRGQQIKVFSQILYFTSAKNYLVPSSIDIPESDSFVGATVLEPDSGLYHDPIAVLDFASLYPSIIRAHNLCYSTIVLNDIYKPKCESDFKTFNGVTFVQNTPGILPEILKRMAECRKAEKAAMKTAKTKLQKTIHDMNQNAYKVSMNSLYGFLAANMLTCKDIASTVTFVGRQMILKTSNYIEQNFKGSETKVIYGDSVTSSTPILLRNTMTNEICIKSIQTLYNENETESQPWITYDSEVKDYKNNNVYEVWTDLGWVNITRIIRHTVYKKIYSISTLTGYVKVTEDHSLLNSEKQLLKPEQLTYKTLLLSSFPVTLKPEPKNQVLSEYNTFLGYIFTHLKNEEMTILDRHHQKIFDKLIKKFKGVVKKTVDTYTIDSNLIDHVFTKDICIPKSILNDDTQNYAFLQFIYQFNRRFLTQTGEACVYYLAKKYYKNVFIDENTSNIFFDNLSYTIEDPLNQVQSVKYQECTGAEVVYDLETECGRFQAGIGEIIVKNTDSVFVNFKQDFETTKQLGYKAAEEASKLFNDPIKLEFEKIYYPFLLFSKKRYAGMYHNIEKENAKAYLDSKGIVIKRRDNCLLLREIYEKLLNLILSTDFTKQKAHDMINEFVTRLKNNEYPIELLTITKTIKDTYKNKNLPHLIVAEKMKERGLNVQVNERIPYIFIKKPGLKPADPQYKRAEHAIYAQQFNILPDADYYIQKQFFNPLSELLLLFSTKEEIDTLFQIKPKKIKRK